MTNGYIVEQNITTRFLMNPMIFNLVIATLKNGVFGIHWNYIVWRIKNRKLFQRKDLIYTVPSQWMMNRAKSSAMLKNSEIYHLPNPIDTNLFKSSSERERDSFKSKLNLDIDHFIITFNKFIGNKNKLKGIETLEETFRLLESKEFEYTAV